MLKDDIIKIINKAAENSGYSIYESSVYLSGVHTKLTIKIDGENTISHNDCENYSRELSLLLDDSGILPDYSLEISSPGINRRISRLEEFIKYKAAPVKVIYAFDGGQRVAKGILSEINEDEIEISEEKHKVLIKHKDIINANLDY